MTNTSSWSYAENGFGKLAAKVGISWIQFTLHSNDKIDL